MSEKVGLHRQDALAHGARQLTDAGLALQADVRSMLDEMERDVSAIQGSALTEFRQARARMTEALNGLVAWCSDYSHRLADTQTGIDQANAGSGQEFGTAGQGFDALTNMNRP